MNTFHQIRASLANTRRIVSATRYTGKASDAQINFLNALDNSGQFAARLVKMSTIRGAYRKGWITIDLELTETGRRFLDVDDIEAKALYRKLKKERVPHAKRTLRRHHRNR